MHFAVSLSVVELKMGYHLILQKQLNIGVLMLGVIYLGEQLTICWTKYSMTLSLT